MEKNLHPAATRSTVNFDWLQAKYSFNSANFLNSNRIQLGLQDILNKNKALGNPDTYEIRNTKIVTITLEKDNRVLPIEVSMN